VESDRVLAIVHVDRDNRVLEAAAAASADYIVSGDTDLLDLGSFESIPIVTAA
jgi:predicted nucleic acid-binding protein